MKNKIIITAIIIAVIHFILTVSLFIIVVYSFSSDNPAYQSPIIGGVAGRILIILIQPTFYLCGLWQHNFTEEIFKWMIYLGNSFLWGFVIALLINAQTLLKYKKSDS